MDEAERVAAELDALGVVFGLRQRAPELACAAARSSAIRSRSSAYRRAPRRRSARARGRRSCPPAASRGAASPSPGSGGCARTSSGCSIVRAPLRLARLERRLAVGDPRCRPPEHVAKLLLVEPGLERRRGGRGGASPAAARRGSRTRRATCSGEMRPNMSSRSIGLQTDVSKKTPGRPVKQSESAARSAMPACAMISCASGYGVDERAQAHRRSEAARGRRG